MAKASAVLDAPAVEAAVATIHKKHANENPQEKPLTGAEVAKQVAALCPDPAPPGTKYNISVRVAPPAEPGPATLVTSVDGSVEDAVRAFNNGRKDIRTAKQLIIQRV